MRKNSLFTKQLKKHFVSINDSIESSFNKLNLFILNFKKLKLSRDNKAFLLIGIIIILLISYFQIPNFYNKELIQSEIENQILKKYNINLKIQKKIKFGLFPKPHFQASNSSILRNNNSIAEISNLKVFISNNNFFNFNQIEVKDLILKKVNFEITKNDVGFFFNLLKNEPNENEIIIKDSNIFFKENDELLFINKIEKYKFFYDSKNLMNVLTSNNEIFNIPFKLILKNDKFNKKLFADFKSKKFRLTINNVTNLEEEIKKGILDILLLNKSTSLDYKINKNSLIYSSNDNQNNFEGKIDFKPFYFKADFNYEGLSSKNILNDKSIIYDLIKSEIFNNSNLNININLNVKDIVNIDELNDLKLKLIIEEGDIQLSNSSINWKDDLLIMLSESLINYNNENINLVGKVLIKIKDINNFYTSFQIKKNLRKKIKEIQFDINYNLITNDVSFDNIKIDKNSNEEVERFINRFNSKTKREFNKITFKNFINKFFLAYSG